MKFKCFLCDKKCEDSEFVATLECNLWTIVTDGKKEELDGTIENFFDEKICGICSKYISRDLFKFKKFLKNEEKMK